MTEYLRKNLNAYFVAHYGTARLLELEMVGADPEFTTYRATVFTREGEKIHTVDTFCQHSDIPYSIDNRRTDWGRTIDDDNALLGEMIGIALSAEYSP